MQVDLDTPVVTQTEQTTTEVKIRSVTHRIRQNKIVAQTSIGSLVLWEGSEATAKADAGYTCDEMCARVKELAEAQ